MKQLSVTINGVQVGSASRFDWDMPWMSAEFRALPSFEPFKSDFETIRRAYAAKDYELVNSLTPKVSALRIAIVDEQGREEFSTHPADSGAMAMNSVGIREGRIAWRQG